MSTSAEVAGQVSSTGVPQRHVPVNETVLRPAVDIFEDADGITLYADVPGVSKERLNVHIDGTTLLLEGTVQFTSASQADSAALSTATRYRRSFTLSRELQPDQIEARVKDGVLRVRIPKRAENRLRKIEIQ
jgi:HSP20 family molecular chaperone IbpA